MPRALGVDLGSKRIGIAVSDSLGVVATPVGTISRSGDEVRDHDAIIEHAREYRCAQIVVGMPRALDGSIGPAARAAQAEIERLSQRAEEFDVTSYDERMTSVIANRALGDLGVRAKKKKAHVDGMAAAVMLQGFLERAK
ncbi:MAG: Holliday junction resolvase RuvX [Acidimicrobiia bacterium]